MAGTPDPYANLRRPGMGTQPPPAVLHGVEHRILTSDDDKYNLSISLATQHNAYLKRLLANSFNHARPVDEYITIGEGTTDPNQGLQINPDYTITEKYTAIAFSLPLGTTAATLQIGTDRIIPLYSGTAIATQSLQVIQGIGILADPNDKRMLFVTGATSEGYLNLIGHAFSNGDNSI